MKVFLLFFLVYFSLAEIQDNYPISYVANNHTYSNEIINLSNYSTILISDSTFTNSLLNISNTSSFSLYNSILTGKYPNETYQFIGVRIASQNIQNNTFRGQTSTSSECTNMNIEIQYSTDQNDETILLEGNYFEYIDMYPSRGYELLSNSSFTLISSRFNRIRVVISTDLYTFTGGITKCAGQNDTLQTQLESQNYNEAWLSFQGASSTNIYLYNNTMDFSTGSTTKEKHSYTNWMFDSLIRLDGFNRGSILYQNNYIYNSNTTLDAPVRVSRLYTGMTSSFITSSHSLSLPITRYQYIAQALIEQNGPQVSGAYTHDVQMQQDSTDEFQGWNPCHYACRHSCTFCLFVDETKHSIEFSQYTHGNCFQRGQVFSKLIRATRLCAHSKLYITTPYRSDDALVFASKNKVDGILEVLPRVQGGLVTFVMNSTINSLSEYKATLDYSSFLTLNDLDPFWTLNKPFIILSKEVWNSQNQSLLLTENENAYLLQLKFTSIVFEVKNDDLCNYLFTTNIGSSSLYTDSTRLTLLEFNNSPIRGISPSQAFSSSGNLLHVSSSNGAGWSNIIPQGIETILFTNGSSYEWMGPLVDLSSLNISNLYILDSTMNRILGGLYDNTDNHAIENIVIQNVNATNSYVNSINGRFLKLIGYENAQQLYIENLQVFRSDSSIADGTIATRSFEFGHWDSIVFNGTITDGKVGVGLYFYNLTQYPCNFFTFVSLINLNPRLTGSIQDYMCSSEELSCKGQTCFDSPTLTPIACTVDKDVSIMHPLFRIQYFQTLQSAIYFCLARTIYVTRNFYEESGLIFKNRYTPAEQLYIIGLNSPIIIGADALIESVSGSQFNLSLNALRFVNTRGFLTHSDTMNDNILYSGDTARLFAFELKNCTFYAQQPFDTLTSLPTTMTEWDTFLSALGTVNVSRVPNIYRPNTNQVINIGLEGPSYLENNYFFGSQYSAYNEYKPLDAKQSTIIIGQHGQNQYSNFISTTGYDVLHNDSTCTLCGGLSTSYNVYSVFKHKFWTGRRLSLNNLYSDAFPNTTSTIRFPYGNPYVSISGTTVLGMLTGLWISGGSGTEWIDWKIRNVTVKNYPIDARFESVTTSLYDFNNVAIYRDDERKIPRQLTFMNDQLDASKMKTVIIGSPSVTDLSPAFADYCDNLCIPDLSTSSCYVSSSYTTESSERFLTIQKAITLCVYSIIRVLDVFHYENITTNYVYTATRLTDTTTLTIMGTVPSIQVIGNQNFISSCPSSTQIPTNIIWKDITFKNEIDQTNSIVSMSSSLSTPCPLTNVTFDNARFLKGTLPTVWNSSKAFECVDCRVSNLNFIDTTVSGAFDTSLYIEGSDTKVYSRGLSVLTPTNNAIKLIYIGGFNIQEYTITCANTLTTYCIDILGSTGLDEHVIARGLINTEESPKVSRGIYWDVDQALSPSQLDILTEGWIDVAGTVSGYHIHLVAPSFEDYFPCDTLDNQYILNLYNRSPNAVGKIYPIIWTGRLSTILTAIIASSAGVSCMVVRPANEPLGSFILLYSIYGVVLIAFGFLVYVSIYGGARCMVSKESYRKQRDFEKIERQQNTERRRIVNEKTKNLTHF